jgi:N-acetylglucosamine-6-phosphate deacetylase
MVVRRLADRQMKLAGLPTTVTITDDEITCASAACRTAWSWTAFNGVLTVPGFWMLRVNGVNAVALDQEDLSPDQLSEVRAFLAARGLVPTAYRVS